LSQGRRPLNFATSARPIRGDSARLSPDARSRLRPTVGVVWNTLPHYRSRRVCPFAGRGGTADAELRIPIVARLIGRNLDDAIQILSASTLSVTVEPDLGRAIDLTLAALAGEGGRRG
jgi:hypothetical protein